jgi:DUF4097 and DUF4098 domain-containing protein YvlB
MVRSPPSKGKIMSIKTCHGLLISGLLLSVPIAVTAGEEVDERRAASATGVVEIHNTRGEVEISGWDKDEVEVIGELDELADELIFDVDGEFTLIRVKLPKRNISWGDGSDLVIRVPVKSRVDFNGVSTDVSVSDIEGGASIHSVSGDVRAEHIAKRLLINSVSGSVEVTDATGKAKITTVSGDLRLDVSSTEISVNAVSGEVDLDLENFDSLSASTVSGELEITGHLNDSGNISMNTVSGDIDLRLTDPVNARIDVNSGPGGDINNGITRDEPRDIFPAQMELKTSAGNASGRIRIKTVVGDINLESGG